MGLIVPGGWEEFFRFIGEPYSGPMWPLHDDRNFFEVLLPKLKEASEQFDMVPCPQQKHFDPLPWDGSENSLPGKLEPYFLKNNSGPAYVVGGMVCRPLVTTAESNDKFAIGSIEASAQHHGSSVFGNEDGCLSFDIHHAFQLVDGQVAFVIDGACRRLHAGELVYIPKDSAFRFTVMSRFAKLFVFSNGGGMVELLRALGKTYGDSVLPEQPQSWDKEQLERLQPSFGGMKLVAK